MQRRLFLKQVALGAVGTAAAPCPLFAGQATSSESVAAAPAQLDPAVAHDWLARWEKGILSDSRNRYCDREVGEEIGWLISPFLSGFYYGYLATRDVKWVALFTDWADAWIQRGVKEPDAFIGWPKSGSGGAAAEGFYSDSLLGEAMGLRPVVLMAAEIQRTPALMAKYGPRAEAWLTLAGRVFEKWDTRGCWRTVKDGGLWVVPAFGFDQQSGKWTDGYARRATAGFSNPANKQNHIARWLLAMHDVTKQPVYRERAEQWFRLMRSRMRTRADGKYFVWNYWDPAGPWDYKPDESPQHWVGVHPNGGYYAIDVEGMVAAYEQGLVFSKSDLQCLIATNRDFMWNQQVAGAQFQRIDGGPTDARWKSSVGVLWTALVPHDDTLRKVFLAHHNPAGWGGLAATPWFLAQAAAGTAANR